MISKEHLLVINNKEVSNPNASRTSNCFTHSHNLQSNVKQLNDFQKFLLQQIQQLQRSSLSKRSTSNVVAIENNYGALKESIINYYFEEQACRSKKNLHEIESEVLTLKQLHRLMKNYIQQAINNFSSFLSQQMESIAKEHLRLEEENYKLKGKIRQMSSTQIKMHDENKQLKRHLKEWEQAKEIRKMKLENKQEPTIENIEKIIRNKLKQDPAKMMTPLKEFNFQSFMSKRASACQSVTGVYQNQLEQRQAKKMFRGSSITDVKCQTYGTFAKSLCFGEQSEKENYQRRKSKQKLKVVSIEP